MVSQFCKPVPKLIRTLNENDNIVDQPQKKLLN